MGRRDLAASGGKAKPSPRASPKSGATSRSHSSVSTKQASQKPMKKSSPPAPVSKGDGKGKSGSSKRSDLNAERSAQASDAAQLLPKDILPVTPQRGSAIDKTAINGGDVVAPTQPDIKTPKHAIAQSAAHNPPKDDGARQLTSCASCSSISSRTEVIMQEGSDAVDEATNDTPSADATNAKGERRQRLSIIATRSAFWLQLKEGDCGLLVNPHTVNSSDEELEEEEAQPREKTAAYTKSTQHSLRRTSGGRCPRRTSMMNEGSIFNRAPSVLKDIREEELKIAVEEAKGKKKKMHRRKSSIFCPGKDYSNESKLTYGTVLYASFCIRAKVRLYNPSLAPEAFSEKEVCPQDSKPLATSNTLKPPRAASGIRGRSREASMSPARSVGSRSTSTTMRTASPAVSSKLSSSLRGAALRSATAEDTLSPRPSTAPAFRSRPGSLRANRSKPDTALSQTLSPQVSRVRQAGNISVSHDENPDNSRSTRHALPPRREQQGGVLSTATQSRSRSPAMWTRRGSVAHQSRDRMSPALSIPKAAPLEKDVRPEARKKSNATPGDEKRAGKMQQPATPPTVSPADKEEPKNDSGKKDSRSVASRQTQDPTCSPHQKQKQQHEVSPPKKKRLTLASIMSLSVDQILGSPSSPKQVPEESSAKLPAHTIESTQESTALLPRPSTAASSVHPQSQNLLLVGKNTRSDGAAVVTHPTTEDMKLTAELLSHANKVAHEQQGPPKPVQRYFASIKGIQFRTKPTKAVRILAKSDAYTLLLERNAKLGPTSEIPNDSQTTNGLAELMRPGLQRGNDVLGVFRALQLRFGEDGVVAVSGTQRKMSNYQVEAGLGIGERPPNQRYEGNEVASLQSVSTSANGEATVDAMLSRSSSSKAPAGRADERSGPKASSAKGTDDAGTRKSQAPTPTVQQPQQEQQQLQKQKQPPQQAKARAEKSEKKESLSHMVRSRSTKSTTSSSPLRRRGDRGLTSSSTRLSRANPSSQDHQSQSQVEASKASSLRATQKDASERARDNADKSVPDGNTARSILRETAEPSHAPETAHVPAIIEPEHDDVDEHDERPLSRGSSHATIASSSMTALTRMSQEEPMFVSPIATRAVSAFPQTSSLSSLPESPKARPGLTKLMSSPTISSSPRAQQAPRSPGSRRRLRRPAGPSVTSVI